MNQTTVLALAVLASGILALAGTAWSEPSPPTTQPDPSTGAELQQKRKEEELQRRAERAKQSVAECEKQIQVIQQKQADNQPPYWKPVYEKSLAFWTKNLELSRGIQKAIEDKQLDKAEKLQQQQQELSAEWWTIGEQKARMEAERARWQVEMGDFANDPEIKAAWEKVNQLNDSLLQKQTAKLALEKETRELRVQLRDASLNLQRVAGEARRKKAAAEHPAEPKE